MLVIWLNIVDHLYTQDKQYVEHAYDMHRTLSSTNTRKGNSLRVCFIIWTLKDSHSIVNYGIRYPSIVNE